MPTAHFSDVNTIFYDDLYQALPMLDFVIFNSKPNSIELMPSNFWNDNDMLLINHNNTTERWPIHLNKKYTTRLTNKRGYKITHI